jgi:hypothetical protein
MVDSRLPTTRNVLAGSKTCVGTAVRATDAGGVEHKLYAEHEVTPLRMTRIECTPRFNASMDKTVADPNIEYFKKLLETETNPVMRQNNPTAAGRRRDQIGARAGQKDRKRNLIINGPRTPMRRAHDDALVGLRVDPAIVGATASKHQSVQRAAFNHCKLKITTKWRDRNIFPR